MTSFVNGPLTETIVKRGAFVNTQTHSLKKGNIKDDICAQVDFHKPFSGSFFVYNSNNAIFGFSLSRNFSNKLFFKSIFYIKKGFS